MSKMPEKTVDDTVEEDLVDTPGSSSGDAELVKEEKKATGSMAWGVVVRWFRGMGCVLGPLAVVLGFLAYGALAFADRWLAHWVKEAEEAQAKNEDIDNTFYAYTYGVACVAHVVFLVFDGFTWAAASVRSGRNIHEQCVHRVLRAPVSWYEENPSGRLLSRFSTDIAMVDSVLTIINEQMFNFLLILSMLAVIIIIILPWMAIPLVLGCAFFSWCISHRPREPGSEATCWVEELTSAEHPHRDRVAEWQGCDAIHGTRRDVHNCVPEPPGRNEPPVSSPHRW
eukprot:Sspe_Gene.28592::Locus_13075_Transcript_2_2_Confidence_0.667_Length_3090::g.28592::m.28592